MKRFLLLFMLLPFFSCNDDLNNPDVMIEYGTTCGWGVGEFINISQNKIDFNRTYYEDGNRKTESKSKTVSDNDWNELLKLYDFSFFKTLNYHSGNISFDGCDEVIRINQVDKHHEISYDPSTEIEGLEMFQERLNELLIEMREY